jgi:hypothetical protein
VKPPIFRAAAAADFEDAYRWYENQRVGLGDEFLAAVVLSLNLWRRTLNAFLLFIGRHAVQTCGVFPYSLFSRILMIKS